VLTFHFGPWRASSSKLTCRSRAPRVHGAWAPEANALNRGKDRHAARISDWSIRVIGAGTLRRAFVGSGRYEAPGRNFAPATGPPTPLRCAAHASEAQFVCRNGSERAGTFQSSEMVCGETPTPVSAAVCRSLRIHAPGISNLHPIPSGA
jgi:hypothetical protein